MNGESIRLLLSAYDCDPDRGSEARLSWNYVKELSRLGHRIHVLTSTRSEDHLPAALDDLNASVDYPVEATYVDDHPAVRRLPNVGYMGRYLIWQYQALDVARAIDTRFDADLVHHVGWGSLQGGSRLWRLGKPFVFGPVGGGQYAPPAFRHYFGDAWRSEWLRTMILVRSVRLLPAARGAVRNAAVVLAANHETYAAVEKLGSRRVVLFRDVAIPEELVLPDIEERDADEPLRLIWLARNLPRKALPLALDAVAKVDPGCSVRLTVVGADGSEAELRDHRAAVEASAPDVDRLTFRGSVDFVTAQQALRASDVFLFTSLRDTTGVQLLEALANGLAVITLDHQGGRELITDDVGSRVPVIDPDQTTSEMARTIEQFASDRQRLNSKRKAALAKARTLSWSGHAAAVDELYRSLAVV